MLLWLLLLLHTAAGRGSRIVAVVIVANASDVVIIVVLTRPHHILGLGVAMWPRTRLRCICEGQAGGINNAIIAHQRNGHLCGLSHPKPFTAELGNLGHHAKQRLRAAVHGLRLHIAEPHLQMRRKVVATEL